MSETIFALSSAPGRAGVAVLRISGPAAGACLDALAGGRPEPRVAVLRRIRDGEGAALDRGLVLWFPGPRSFTGEDLAELHVHGGHAVVAALSAALAVRPGVRPAEAGEFTRRAFDAGKLDLTEVEGLADLIDAETRAQARQALRQMEGAFGRRVEDWRQRLLHALAHLEAEIDFADEELPAGLDARVRAEVAALAGEIDAALADERRGERLRAGLTVAIIGATNAGKSSLLNALVRREAAIVAETAGTTRDVVEVHLDLGGYPVTLADTAGLRELPAEAAGHAGIEAEGIWRARARAESADLRLAVFEATRAPDPATLALLDADTLVVRSKADLLDPAAAATGVTGDHPALSVSAETGQGMPALLARLQDAAASLLVGAAEAQAITRTRHRTALRDTVEALHRAGSADLPELAAEDLRLATRALGRITGRVDVEDLLDVIFRDFCIGK